MELLKKILSHRFGRAGFLMFLSMVILCYLAPILAPYDPFKINEDLIFSPPSLEHPFGTDSLGRDLLSRILYGGRISLSVGFIAVGIALVIGVILGSLAGFYGGLIDTLISRFIDIMLCFPTIFLILALIALFEKPSLFLIMVIIGLTSWMGPARLIRAQILSLKEQDFIFFLKSLGISNKRIILKHLIPNALGPVVVSGTLGVGTAILVESALSFLGLGVQPPIPSWGNILIEAKQAMSIAPWVTFFPGLFIFLTVLAVNFIGEALREHFR